MSVVRWGSVALAAICLTLSLPHNPASAGPTVTIHVDANRDGTVDTTGDSDADDREATWTKGALILPNLDDDSGRCQDRDTRCNDGTDTVVNGAKDADDLARIVVDPVKGLPAGSEGRIIIMRKGAAENTRLFRQQGNSWTAISQDSRFSVAELEAGMTLGIEATDIVRNPAEWDGRFHMFFVVTTDNMHLFDAVAMHVAPMLTHHHQQTAQSFIAAPSGGAASRQFMTDFRSAVRTAGHGDVVRELRTNDRWAQDWVEPAYAAIPTQDGTQSIRLLVRSNQKRDAQMQLYTLRGDGVGVIQIANSVGRGTRDSFGNLETIPPHTGYPAGRIILGFDDAGINPSDAMVSLWRAQKLQDPLKLDTSWLSVGHVDEFVQFLPADNARGFVVAVSDPAGAIEVLKAAERAGNGSAGAGTRGGPSRMTISELLANRTFQSDQQRAIAAIDANIRILTEALDLKASEIVRIPGLYTGEERMMAVKSDVKNQVEAAGGPTRAQARIHAGAMGALFPMAINSVVTADNHVAAAQQFGPQVGGRDILADAVADAYRKAGMTVSWVDDYDSYHVYQGEVHCGTNSIRAIPRRWW